MAKKVTANGKTFTFDDNVTNEQIGSAIDEYFSSLKKKEVSQPVVPTGSQPLLDGSKIFQAQVDTKIPSVLTPKEVVKYKERVKDYVPPVQKQPAAPKQEPTSGYENIAPLMSGLQSTVSSFYKIPRYIYNVFAMPQNAIAELANIPELKANYDNVSKGALNPLSYLEYAGDYAKGEADKWESRQRKYDEDITSQLFKSKDYAGAALQIYDNVVASAPSIASMFLTGGAAGAAKLGSVSSKIATALPFASAKSQELEQNENIPEWLKPANAALDGLSEIMLEGKFGTTAILNGATKIAAKEGAEAAANSVKDFIYNYTKKALSKVQPVTDVVSNALEEMATKMSQNIIAKATGEDVNRGIMDGVTDAGIVGGAQGAAATSLRKGLDVVINKKSKEKVQKLTKQRDDLVNDLDNDDVPDTVKEQIETKLEAVNEELNNTLEENRNEINNLPEETKVEVSELANRIEAIKDSLASESISETSKALLEEELKAAEQQLDNLFKAPQPRIETEEDIIKEIRAAEAELEETGDFANYKVKIDDLNKRLENLVPDPEVEGEVVAKEDVEAKKVDIEKRRQEELNSFADMEKESVKKSTKGTPINKDFPNATKVGDKFNEGLRVIVKDAQIADNFDPNIAENEGEGYTIIDRILEYGEMKDGQLSKAPVLRTMIFNNKADADAYLEQQKQKFDNQVGKSRQYDKINAKYDAELAALEQQTKPKEDAIQVETAGQVPVQPEARVGEKVEEGKPEPEAEVVTEEGKEEVAPAKAKAAPRAKPRVQTRLKFQKAIELFNDISTAEGGAKKRSLTAKRRTFLEQNPSIKYIDDNWKNISQQLEAKGLITKEGNCP